MRFADVRTRCSVGALLLRAVAAAGCSDSTATSETSGVLPSTSGEAGCPPGACSSSPDSDSQSESEAPGTDTGAICGNGLVEPPEQCDGAPVFGVPCPDTCRFEPATVLWEAVFDWQSGSDKGRAIAIASDSSIVVAGDTGKSDGQSGPLLVWVSEDGLVLRSAVAEPDPDQGLRPHAATSVHVDADGVVAAGRDWEREVWLARYSHDGDLVWQTGYSAMDPDSPTTAGNAFGLEDGRIALVTYLDLGGMASGRIAYFEEEMLESEEQFSGPEYMPGFDSLSQLRGVALSAADVLVFGSARTGVTRYPWMQRRVLGGEAAWELMLDSQPGELLDRFTDAAIAADGTLVLVAHRTLDPAELRDAWVGAFSPDGVLLWSDAYTGEYQRDDFPSGVATDVYGNAFVHLTVSDDNHPQPEANYDFVLIKYDSAGERQWLERWSGTGDGNGLMSWDQSGGVAVDPDGFVVVTGSTLNGDFGYDVIVRKLAP